MSVDMKVPDIRFSGFSGEWEEKELSDSIVIIGTGKSIFVANAARTEQNNFPILGSRGVIGYDSTYDYSGNFILTARVGENAGRLYKYSGDVKITDNTVFIKSDSLDFIFYLLTNFDLRRLAFGTGQPLIKASELNELKIFSPLYKQEQTQIGNTFQKLDSLINQHQQKHDKLSNIKKAMLEKMFPRRNDELRMMNAEGASKENSALSTHHSSFIVPEIRFKGFSGEWEEKELGELAEIVRGASPRPIEDQKWFDRNSNVGWLRIRDVTEQDGRIHHLVQRISKLGQEKTRVLREKHLLLSIAASVGKPVINYVETGVHDGFLIFKKPLFELEFMYQWLKSFELEWQQYGQPGSQVNLNSDIVKNQVIAIPSNAEQTAIGNYFKKLDTLINQHQQQITKLNNIKQACLNKMFA